MGMWAADDNVDHDNIAEIGLKKLLFALSTRRVIGFVGSMATEDFDYGKWKEIIKRYYAFLLQAYRKGVKEEKGSDPLITKKLEGLLDTVKSETDDVLAIDIVEDLFREQCIALGVDFEKVRAMARKKFAENFYPEKLYTYKSDKQPIEIPEGDPARLRETDLDIPRALFRSLRLNRVLTLNYDLELEIAALGLVGGLDRVEAIEKITSSLKASPDDSINVAVPEGARLFSQVVTRDRTDTLTEFAMGLPDRRVAVLHLHGRYDRPASIILSKSDYRNLYWRSGLSKTPVEHGLRTVFIGNPILCIGLGMSEADVNRTFEQFMSDAPMDTEFPRFLLWGNHYDDEGKPQPEKDTAFRLRMFRELGIFVIFASDVDVGLNTNGNKRLLREFKQSKKGLTARQKKLGDKAKERLKEKKKARESQVKRELLLLSLEKLGDMLENYGKGALGVWTRESFCIPSPKIGENAFPVKTQRLTLWDPMDSPKRSGARLVMKVEDRSSHEDAREAVRQTILAPSNGDLIAISGRPGIGKGTLANRIHQSLASEKEPGVRSVLINAAFTMDSDGLMITLSGILDGTTAFEEFRSRREAIRRALELDPLTLRHWIYGQIKKTSGKGTEIDELVVIVNGMGRFLGHAGDPLSIEVDAFVREVVASLSRQSRHSWTCSQEEDGSVLECLDFDDGLRIRLVLMGTRRMRRYIKETFPNRFTLFEAMPCRDSIRDTDKPNSVVVDPEDGRAAAEPKLHINFHSEGDGKPEWRHNYLSALLAAVGDHLRKTKKEGFEHERNNIRSAISAMSKKTHTVDRKIRRETFEIVLNPIAFSDDDHDSDLLLYVLQTMAAIGQPIEWTVLRHPRRIRERLAKLCSGDGTSGEGSADERLKAHIEHLRRLKLVLEVGAFDDCSGSSSENSRIALHKSVLSEFRERFGIRQSDAHLTSTFNLSLYAAQPADTHGPLASTMRRLEMLAGDLTHAYKDEIPLVASGGHALNTLPYYAVSKIKKEMKSEGLVEWNDRRELTKLATREVSACLRAAYTLLRSYYPISSLLVTSADVNHDAPLRGLARLLKRLIDISEAQTVVQKVVSTDEALRDHFQNPAPFHPDDIMWMYNEIGVIELILGRIYRAERAFDAALRINRKFVEFGDRQHNWRRIQINRLNMLIDRGKLDEANAELERLRAAIDEEANRVASQYGSGSSEADSLPGLDRIVQAYGISGTRTPYRSDPSFPRELVLNTGLYLGYRAVLETLKGAFESGLFYFGESLAVFTKLGERRAYALFQGHRVSVLTALGRNREAREALELCVNASSAIHHSDLNNYFRATVFFKGAEPTELESKSSIAQLKHSLEYARRNKMYRIQIQILALLAKMHRQSTDFEAAIAADSEAIALSARFGHGLRKVNLRNTLAEDYILRANPLFRESALRLIGSASTIGTKIGYNTCVERSERLRISLQRPVPI